MVTSSLDQGFVTVAGSERGERVSVSYHDGDQSVFVGGLAGSESVPLRSLELRLLNGTLSVGERKIQIEAGAVDAARRLATVVERARQRELEASARARRVTGFVLAVLSPGFLLAACVMNAAQDMGRDNCRALRSWQTERPVEGCEDESMLGIGLTAGIGVLMLIGGVTLVALSSDD